MRRIVLGVTAVPLAACAIALVGCGGASGSDAESNSTTSAASRNAAGAGRGDTFGCSPQDGFTYQPTISNRLPTPITLYAREYDCNDWDGDSTPGHAFTGQVIPAKSSRTFTLQPAMRTTRNWTMDIYGFTDAHLGTVRMKIPQRPDSAIWIEVDGSKIRSPASFACGVNDLAYTAADQTPYSEWPKYSSTTALALVSDKGRVALVSRCL